MAGESQQSNQPRWQLVLDSGPGTGQIFPVAGDVVTIGRGLDNDIVLDDQHVSKHHARLTKRGDRLIVEDLNSINGTLVNGTTITGLCLLEPNDRLTLGSFSLRVEDRTTAVPQARLETQVYPTSQPSQSRSERTFWLVAALVALFVLTIVMGVGGWFIFNTRSGLPVETPTPATAGTGAPNIVINQAPPQNSELNPNQSITVQATASDPSGVSRMALWVNGEPVDQVASQLAQDVPAMTAAFQWSADTPGSYSLEIRAYNQANLVSVEPVVTLSVIGEPTPAPVPTETPTITPLPSEPVLAGTPVPASTLTPTSMPATSTPQPASLTVTAAGLNVRAGPGTQYQSVGVLRRGDQAEIVGQATVGQNRWWQIRFEDAPDALGWVSADPAFSTAVDSADVPVIEP